MKVVAEGGFDLFAFVFAEETIIDEDADESVAYGFVEQGGGNGGIDATGEATDDPGFAFGYAVASSAVIDLFLDLFDGIGDEVAHFPVASAGADIVEEIFQDNRAFGGVRNLRVELDAEEFLFFVFYDGEGAGFCGGELDEVVVGVLDLVAVAFPDGCGIGEVREEARFIGDGEICPSVFPVFCGDDFCAEDGAAKMHAVADSEDGDAEVEDFLVAFDGVFVIDACGAA